MLKIHWIYLTVSCLLSLTAVVASDLLVRSSADLRVKFLTPCLRRAAEGQPAIIIEYGLSERGNFLFIVLSGAIK